VQRFLAEDPKHGEHRYSLARFGIDREAEARRFRPSCERFGLGD